MLTIYIVYYGLQKKTLVRLLNSLVLSPIIVYVIYTTAKLAGST